MRKPKHNRRAVDKCFMRRIYDKATPYLQIGGYLIMMGTLVGAIWLGFSFLKDTNDANAAVMELQLWRSSTNVDMAALKQEVHDIHEWIKPHR